MGSYLRFAASSASGLLLGQFLNIYIISKLKILVGGRYFWLCSVSSTILGDGITIFIALIFVFYGRMPFLSILEIIFFEIALNMVYSTVIAFPAVYIVRYLKHAENMDTFDINISYNPFRFNIDK